MIVLYQFEISPFCDKIRRVLHWKRQPYEVREIPAGQSPWRLKRIHPVGKLPCLEHEGRRVVDSSDIAAYLEERFPDPPLLPSEERLRAEVHVLEDWADESLYFYEMRLRFSLPHNARRWLPVLLEHDPPWLQRVAPVLLGRFFRSTLNAQGLGRRPDDRVFADVEQHVRSIGAWLGERDWLVGDALTLADIAVFAQLYCIRGADEGRKIIDAHPVVENWMQRVDRATAKPSA